MIGIEFKNVSSIMIDGEGSISKQELKNLISYSIYGTTELRLTAPLMLLHEVYGMIEELQHLMAFRKLEKDRILFSIHIKPNDCELTRNITMPVPITHENILGYDPFATYWYLNDTVIEKVEYSNGIQTIYFTEVKRMEEKKC